MLNKFNETRFFWGLYDAPGLGHLKRALYRVSTNSSGQALFEALKHVVVVLGATLLTAPLNGASNIDKYKYFYQNATIA
jgi:hypothetical protein